jgi:hypothetical protein
MCGAVPLQDREIKKHLLNGFVFLGIIEQMKKGLPDGNPFSFGAP